MTSVDYLKRFDFHALYEQSLTVKPETVIQTLKQSTFSLSDLPTLISPAASQFIESLAQRSYQITRQRFGNMMQLFVPLYLSNECYNHCTYCNFSIHLDYPRKTLTDDEIIENGKLLKSKGFNHILLLTGEAPKTVDVNYIGHAIKLLSPLFSSIGVEIQPLKQSEYEYLIKQGCDSLTVYQETYEPDIYKQYHLTGKKRLFENRLYTPEEGAKAGFFKINLGALLGLYDWRFEALNLGYHLSYLHKHYWKVKYGISFPRITETISSFSTLYPVKDIDIVQIICAFRLLFNDLSITLSTREHPSFRNHVMPLGVTHLSAESNTSPGGYCGTNEQDQFQIHDSRSVHDISKQLHSIGLDPVVKDWDQAFIR
ncbi:2-iminoacetate synthase ThiH [Candidatus Marinamargulisbacteria bacterium SCGC AG-410-N11]|nr:2-iminoacetate synthase ThiH [Candidatus Marinamargulisbacteria bacterium SCGC AG-410-N11]